MEEQNKLLREELRLSKESEKFLLENARLSCENGEMRKELKALKGTVERVEIGFEMMMQENEERIEKRMEAMMGQVIGMIKTFMGEGAVGGVVSASGKGLIVEEKARKNEKKGKSSEKREKKKGQDESEDDHEWVKVVSKKKGKMGMIKDKNLSIELDSLYSNEERNKKGLGSEESSENEVEVCKTVVMREVLRCDRFNEHSSRDV
ncbi:uncharacterized protein [Palaemon carinicauda]|uniref:uncharacterized protein n=1 Tax=Palaemon carinicauda TaxID=392227 RepID=UPI0035B59563